MTDFDEELSGSFYDLRVGSESRYNKAHDKLGKFASTGGSGGSAAQYAMGPDGQLHKLGETFVHNGKKYKMMTQAAAAAYQKQTPAKPSTIKTAPKSKSAKTAAVKEPVALPKKRGGTQKVESLDDAKWTNRKSYDQKVPRKLSKAEEEAILEYDDPVGAHYMNWTARLGSFDKVPIAAEPGKALVRRTAAQTKRHSDNLSAAIQKHKTPHDLMVSRRVGAQAFGASTRDDADGKFVLNAVGGVMQDKGFMSTTLLKDVSDHHPMFSANAPVKINIRVPKGTPALSLGTKVEEVVFDKNTKIAILSATKGSHKFKSGKVATWWVVEAQIVP